MKTKKETSHIHDCGRVLVFGPPLHEGESESLNMPFKEGYMDYFSDAEEAKKAMIENNYQFILADYTVLYTPTIELLNWARTAPQNASAICAMLQTHIAVSASMWKLDAHHTFLYEGLGLDAMTLPMSALFHSRTPLKWIAHVQSMFYMMRREMENQTKRLVFLVGEAGTAKFTLAQIAHFRSHRRTYPFVFANCKNNERPVDRVWDDTDISKFKKSIETLFREADKGTLYLHQVDRLDLEAQNILAEMLRSDKYDSPGEPFPALIICSSRGGMAESVQSKRSSRQLFNMLSRHTMRIPPLSEYREDIALLAQKMLHNYCISRNKQPQTFTKKPLEIIAEHPWSHNIREVFDVVKHASELVSGTKISERYLSFKPHVEVNDTDSDKRHKIRKAIKDAKGKKNKAAEILGVSPKTLYAWMHKLGMSLDLYKNNRQNTKF